MGLVVEMEDSDLNEEVEDCSSYMDTDQSIDIDVAFSDIVRVLLMFYADLFAV